MKAQATPRGVLRPLLAAAAALAMATSFTGCDLIEWLTCVQYGECAQVGPIVPPADEVVPDAPTNLTATAGDGQVTLSWTPSTAEDVTEYQVVYSTVPGGQRTQVVTVQGKAASSAVDTGRANGTTLYYVVYSHDAAGNRSPASNEASATPTSAAPAAGGRVPMLEWGGPGAENGRFNRPSGIATGPAGDVYVVDKQNYRVQRFSATGQFLTKWGGQGSGSGQFDLPHGIASDPDGFVYVTDVIDKDVQKFTSEGTFVTSWENTGPPSFEEFDPVNIATGRDGEVYVTSSDNYVYLFTSNGQFVKRWGTGPFGTHDPGDLHDPDGIARDAFGRVYVTQEGADRVEKFNQDGDFILSWGGPGTGEGQFDNAHGIAYAPSGSVFVADSANHRIQQFTPTGTFVSQFGSRGQTSSQFDFPAAVATDCRSRLYVVDQANNRILVFGDPQTGPPPCGSSPGQSKQVGGVSALVLETAAGKFRATSSRTALTRGTRSQSGLRWSEKGIVAAGRFTGRLGSRRRGLSLLAPFSRGGTWRTRFDVTADLATAAGTARGYTLATARRKSGGRVCLKFTTRFKVVGGKLQVNGTFRSTGGTRAGGTLIASGRFKQSYRADKSFTLAGTGRAREGRRRGLPAACRSLVI